ncbi:hypothetical protein HAX54_043481, partial [Datura stramonium]|nr:hypothetical protein [Datura stramonium]
SLLKKHLEETQFPRFPTWIEGDPVADIDSNIATTTNVESSDGSKSSRICQLESFHIY